MKQIQEWLAHSTFAITAAFAEEEPTEEQDEESMDMSLSM